MDYLNVYKMAFSDPLYSNDFHPQYEFATSSLSRLELPSNRIIDIGSGRGQILKILYENKDKFKLFHLTSVDLERFNNEPIDVFIPCDLANADDRQRVQEKIYDAVICTDVLEHLDKSFIVDVLRMFANLAPVSILAIANHSDVQHGVELHTIQENDTWWEKQMEPFFHVQVKECLYNGRLYEYVVKSKIFT